MGDAVTQAALRGTPAAPVLGCGDASGCKSSADTCLRRVRWAWVVVECAPAVGEPNGAAEAGTSAATDLGDFPWRPVVREGACLAGMTQAINRDELSTFGYFPAATVGPAVVCH